METIGKQAFNKRYHARMKPKVYLETSVVSYWTAPPSRDARVAAFQQATHEWFSAKHAAFDLFVSDLVVEEASAGDASHAQARLTAMKPFPRLLIAPEARKLAPFVLKSANLPPGALADALHISVAALNGMDYVLTWNMRHIANEDIRQRLRAAFEKRNIVCPKLATPLEFLGD